MENTEPLTEEQPFAELSLLRFRAKEKRTY